MVEMFNTPATEKVVAIVQSNYIPWKGYFDLINLADEFILYDDMQYTKRDWRNRNKIKTPNGSRWLTIPVQVKGKYNQAIKDTLVDSSDWRTQHWNSIRRCYRRAPFFNLYKDSFQDLYLNSDERRLSRINHAFIALINSLMGIKTKITWSMDYDLGNGKTERLVDLCRQASASAYLSGPSALRYIDEKLFHNSGTDLRCIDYDGYPEYRQLFTPFEHQVSIIDLLFNTGPDARRYMKSF